MYNPRRDREPVSQEGYLNLQQSYVDGIVPSDLDTSHISSNGIQNTGSMIEPISDNFDAMRVQASVRGYKPPSKDGEGE